MDRPEQDDLVGGFQLAPPADGLAQGARPKFSKARTIETQGPGKKASRRHDQPIRMPCCLPEDGRLRVGKGHLKLLAEPDHRALLSGQVPDRRDCAMRVRCYRSVSRESQAQLMI